MTSSHSDIDPVPTVRLDLWLWHVRLFKTRRLAADAVQGGKVHLNASKVKPAHVLRVADQVSVSRPGYTLQLIVRGLPSRRGSAAEAQQAYEESAASRATRETVVEQQKLAAALMPRSTVRPTRQGRRELRRLRGRE